VVVVSTRETWNDASTVEVAYMANTFRFRQVSFIHIILDQTRQAMYVEHNIEARSRNRFCRGKAISIQYYECAFVFLSSLSSMQIAYFLRRIILSSVACLAVPYFFHITS
jgi:protein-S-isoprenylcysteine O-methyltransferase Ste14